MTHSTHLRLLLLLLLSAVATTLTGQAYLLPTHPEAQQRLQGAAARSSAALHTVVQPMLATDWLAAELAPDSVLYPRLAWSPLPQSWQKTWFWRKLRHEDFVDMRRDAFRLQANPLLWYEKSTQTPLSASLLTNTRAVELRGEIGRKFAFYTAFFENQATLPQWVDSFVLRTGMVPGLGTPKPFGDTGHDFSRSEAWISYTPFPWLAIQGGQGKLQVGHGYRSMLLSDNAFVYPYIKFRLQYGPWQWHAWMSQYTDFGRPTEVPRVWHYDYHFRRIASTHVVSYRPNRFFEISLFESTMWQSTDTTAGRHNSFRAAYLAPLPLLQTATQGLNGANNVLLGLDLKISPLPGLQLYGQVLLDNLDASRSTQHKTAWQLGAKYYAQLAGHLLQLQAEYNNVRPYTYAHTLPRSNYTHSNQPLAHPLGANFAEWVAIARYQYAGIVAELRYTQAQLGTDALGEHWGHNIYLSDLRASAPESFSGLQGQQHQLQHLVLQLAYVINPRTNLQVFFGTHRRSFGADGQVSTISLSSFGIRSRLFQSYTDF